MLPVLPLHRPTGGAPEEPRLSPSGVAPTTAAFSAQLRLRRGKFHSIRCGSGRHWEGAHAPLVRHVASRVLRRWRVDAGRIADAQRIDGIIDGSTSSPGTHSTDDFHGLAVQAASSERVFSMAAAAGAGGLLGLAGGVTVEFIESDTAAFIGSNAQIKKTTLLGRVVY